MSSSSSTNSGAIVVVAKCPLPGASKTRLIPLLGEKGAATLAKAMLSDILTSLVQHMKEQQVILYYAPGTDEIRMYMLAILDALGIAKEIDLVPMLHGDLQGRDLGDQLSNALREAQKRTSGNIMFLGMDSPELPIDELQEAFRHPKHATLCPSYDGGYGMVCVPHDAPADTIFSNVLWSHPSTALSQLKALSDANVDIRLGRIMRDIDEPEDVRTLMDEMLVKNEEQLPPLITQGLKSLQESSANKGDAINSDYPRTKQALQELKEYIVKEKA
jgi:glycosyltransferase A (GT-A) superfamily protein (DUF2064 family)